jgi:Signal peptide binding domain
MDQDFTLNDFRKYLEALQKMGLKDMIARMPGTAEMIPEGEDPEVFLKRDLRMLEAMTADDRADPARIDTAARGRVAAAAGTEPDDEHERVGTDQDGARLHSVPTPAAALGPMPKRKHAPKSRPRAIHCDRHARGLPRPTG